MSQQYDNRNKGVLFVNHRKEQEKHPDRKGNALIECPHCQQQTDYWMDGWNNFNQDGSERVNVRFKQKDQAGGSERPQSRESGLRQQAAPQRQQPAQKRADRGGPADMDDDIPF